MLTAQWNTFNEPVCKTIRKSDIYIEDEIRNQSAISTHFYNYYSYPYLKEKIVPMNTPIDVASGT